MTQDKQAMMRLLVETGVYLVTEDAIPAPTRLEAVRQALASGARVVQLRDKHTPRGLLLQEARSMCSLCREYGAVFIVNDDVALAWCADAHGVHVGQDDLPPSEVRRLIGPDKLLGVSVSSMDEARASITVDVDYLGVGAIYSTPTKPNAELGGLKLLRELRDRVSLPLVGIGGIDAHNAGGAFEAGADSVAVVRAVFAQPSVGAATSELLEIARAAKAGRRQG